MPFLSCSKFASWIWAKQKGQKELPCVLPLGCGEILFCLDRGPPLVYFDGCFFGWLTQNENCFLEKKCVATWLIFVSNCTVLTEIWWILFENYFDHPFVWGIWQRWQGWFVHKMFTFGSALDSSSTFERNCSLKVKNEMMDFPKSLQRDGTWTRFFHIKALVSVAVAWRFDIFERQACETKNCEQYCFAHCFLVRSLARGAKKKKKKCDRLSQNAFVMISRHVCESCILAKAFFFLQFVHFFGDFLLVATERQSS